MSADMGFWGLGATLKYWPAGTDAFIEYVSVFAESPITFSLLADSTVRVEPDVVDPNTVNAYTGRLNFGPHAAAWAYEYDHCDALWR